MPLPFGKTESGISYGHPYTIIDGQEDTKRLEDMPQDEIDAIGEWIRANIRRDSSVLPVTTYGLKHMLKRDTGIYISNNGFKDAMLRAGFEPIDASRTNWCYRIALIRDDIINTSPFVEYVRRYECSSQWARDICNDKTFPVFADYKTIVRYVKKGGYCDEFRDFIDEMWKEYVEDSCLPDFWVPDKQVHWNLWNGYDEDYDPLEEDDDDEEELTQT